MSAADYSEPQLTVAVLGFMKPAEERACLESVRRHVKVAHRVVYYHNGPADYAISLYHDGLIDLFLQSRVNAGLGVGTRDLMSVIHTPWTIYLQNDQTFERDLDDEKWASLLSIMGNKTGDGSTIMSISLAGASCGEDVYSERAHLIYTRFYRAMEEHIPLSSGGAGPYHHQQWREGQIQEVYRINRYVHLTSYTPFVADRGVWTLRNVAGGRVRMRTDTKAVWWEETPTERYVFPEHTDAEWEIVLRGEWPAGKIPSLYLDRGESFNCWGEQDVPPSL